MTDNIKMISLPQAEGTVVLSAEDGLGVRLDLHLADELSSTDVLKVYALSTHLPDIYLGMADTIGKKCSFEGRVDTRDACHYDTVSVIKKNAFTDSSYPFVKVCFADDGADADRLQYLQSHKAYREYLSVATTLKSPISRGEEALNSFRAAHMADGGERERCLERLRDILYSACRLGFSFAEGFDWYAVDTLDLSGISTATEHILSFDGVLRALERYGHLVAGVNWKDDILCIAIPTDNPSINPIPHLSDCTGFVKSPVTDTVYCTVCVIFAPDGQYFARLDEQDFS